MSDHKILWPSADEMIPELEDTYVDVEGLLKKIMILTDPSARFGRPANILLNGHHGLGKSLLSATVAVELAKKTGKEVPLVTFDCSEDTFELMLVGSSRVVAGGETPFVPGPFPSAIHLANECGLCVFVAEEISALTPGAQKVFNRMTDWRRGLYVADVNRFFRLKKDCLIIFIASMNPSGYGGVYTLNDDLRSRFVEVQVDFPEPDNEKKILRTVCDWAESDLIDKAVQVAQDSRAPAIDYSLSTRDLVLFLSGYYRLKFGGSPVTFALETLANKFEGSDRNTMIDRIDAVFKTRLKDANKKKAS